MVTLGQLWAEAVRLDGLCVGVIAAFSRYVPAWGEAASLVVRDAPAVALFVWLVTSLMLGENADDARARRLRAVAGALILGCAWAVAWGASGMGSPALRAAFGASARAEVAVAGLPLGAAMLALGWDTRGGFGSITFVLAWAYWLARVAIGADGPLVAAAELASALALRSLLTGVGPVRRWLQASALRLACFVGVARVAVA